MLLAESYHFRPKPEALQRDDCSPKLTPFKNLMIFAALVYSLYAEAIV